MSAAFRLEAKKKVTQHELRRLMQEQKQSRKDDSTVKINSPLAKYENGQLFCVLCKSVVRSEKAWTVHVNAKQHKENLAVAKQLKEKMEVQTKKSDPEERLAGIKRSIEDLRKSDVPEKKLKGILKNSSTSTISKSTDIQPKITESEVKTSTSAIPDDFFDTKPKSIKNVEEEKVSVEETETLPEGFFDDPKKDAKAHNKEYKDPVEEEWDKFQKEIKDAEVVSKTLINEDHEEATVERQIDEIDEQIRNWSRVLEMEKKKEKIELKSKLQNPLKQSEEKSTESSDTESEDEIPEFIDWRSKKSHK